MFQATIFFAATLALVAGYQGGLPWRGTRETALGARIALWGVREVAGLILVSLLAGTATMPFIAYHFHRVAPYGLLGNLLAMPIVSAWVMPMGIFGLIAMPLGLDGYFWSAMGQGIDWMIAVALWVAAIPGALGRMAAFGPAALVICTLGLVLLCLLKTPLRLIGSLLVVGAVIMMVGAPQPDVLIAADGGALAMRKSDGRLAMVRSGSDVFAFREWLAADADPRMPNDPTLAEGIRCDGAGCVGRLRDGTAIALSRSLEALAEDCRRAAVVVSTREVAQGCAALLIDRRRAQQHGALALRRVGEGFEVVASRPAGYDRPWAPMPMAGAPEGANAAGGPRDATPRPEDLEPGD